MEKFLRFKNMLWRKNLRVNNKVWRTWKNSKALKYSLRLSENIQVSNEIGGTWKDLRMSRKWKFLNGNRGLRMKWVPKNWKILKTREWDLGNILSS
jgi:hypothetical protein